MDNIPGWSRQNVIESLPNRLPGSHKGSFGTALLIAGSPGMPGAAVLAAIGAMRSGLGKLVVATSKESIGPVSSVVPEATFEPDLLEQFGHTTIDFSKYKAVAVGPGMIPDQTLANIVEQLLAAEKPLVIDAGALSPRSYTTATAPVILSPHTAEFSRIAGISVEQIQNNRIQTASDFAVKMNVTVVLKGNNTIIAFPDGKTFTNPTGNSALAKGGTGDTLTGMMLGMLCLHENWQHGVLNAVHLHGACADEWVRSRSAHTLVAHELTDLLPGVMKSFEK